MTTNPITRRDVLVGTAAAAGAATLPAIPAVAVETLTPACQVDRAAFTARLHRWALQCPEMATRIDALLSDVDWVLATEDGTGALLDARQVCADHGRKLSLDWLVGGDGDYPSGKPIRMWLEAPDPVEDTPDNARLQLIGLCSSIEPQQQAPLAMAMGAMVDGDYECARGWMGYAFQQAGIVVEQW